MNKILKMRSQEPCENCGNGELEEFVVAKDNVFDFCPKCLLYQKTSPPPLEHYENHYHSTYATRREAKVNTGMIRLGAVTKYINTSEPRMLDIGCSVGATVEAGRRMGWESSGVDVSQAAINFCVESGLDCQKIGGAELPYDDNTFDVVTSWHVIEHVDDVQETLTEWYRVVKPGGVLVLETPDSQCYKARTQGAKYAKFWPHDHLYTFTRSNMCSFLERAGFEILPSKLVGRLDALPPYLTLYGLGYRSWRKLNRLTRFCKSIEVCCRKPLAAANQASVPKRQAA